MNQNHEAALKAVVDCINGDPARDSFRVRCNWKPNANGISAMFVTVDGATSDQLSAPETWLTSLSGGAGGVYEIDIMHASDIRKKICPSFGISINLDRAPQQLPEFKWSALSLATYTGPKKVVFPLREVDDATLNINTFQTPRAAAAAAAGHAEGGREADLLRRETELMVKESEARILNALNVRTPAVASNPITEFLPLAASMFKEMGENRRADAAADRENRRADAQAAREARQDADKRFEALLVSLKPAPVAENPLLPLLITKLLDKDDSSMLRAQSEAMAQTTNSMLQILHTKAEIDNANAPQEDSPLMKLLSKGIDAMVALNGGTLAPTDEAAALGEQEQLEAGEVADDADGETATMKLEKALRQMKPAEEIAELFCTALKDAEFRALKSKFSNWQVFIDSRMGPWAAKDPEKRVQYLQEALIGKAFPLAVERGLLADPKKAKPSEPPKKPLAKKSAKSAKKEEPEDAVIVEEKTAVAAEA